MRSIDGRLSKLENRLGVSAARYLLILMDAGRDSGPLMRPTLSLSMKLACFPLAASAWSISGVTALEQSPADGPNGHEDDREPA